MPVTWDGYPSHIRRSAPPPPRSSSATLVLRRSDRPSSLCTRNAEGPDDKMLFLVAPALFLFLLLAVPYYWITYSRAARLVSNLRGPKPYPIIGNTLEFEGGTPVGILNGLKKLQKQHGFLFRFWLGSDLFAVVADAKYLEHILNSNTNISKNMAYKFLEPWLGTGLLTSTGSKWKLRRRIITPTFHFKILEDFMDVFNSHSNILVQKLKEVADGREFDIYNYITRCSLDIICESAMGVQMNVQDNSSNDYNSALMGLADILVKRMFTPWLFPDFIFNMTKYGKKQREYLKVLHDTTDNVIAKRKQELLANGINGKNTEENDFGQKKRLAFLDLLLQYTKDGANLTDKDIREEVDTFMFEGHDTTATAMTFCLWSLASHPNCQEKVYQEIYDIFGDSDRDATVQDLQDMKYLDAVIKESQRIYPTVPFVFRELDEEVNIDDLHLAKGTNVMITPFVMNYNAEYFPEPEKFDPDRFSAENSQGRNPYAYVPFSAGPRNCIGQRFAVMEMKSTISRVIRNYKITPGSKKVILTAELVLRSLNGIHVKLESRK